MDEEQVEGEFFNIAMNDYKGTIDSFVEKLRLSEYEVRRAIHEDRASDAARLSGEAVMLANSVQTGNVPNVLLSFAHAANMERNAGLDMLYLVQRLEVGLQEFLQHMAASDQLGEELFKIADMVAHIQDTVAVSAYANFGPPDES